MPILVSSSSKTRSHVDIQVRGNILLGICMRVVRISVYSCKYVYIDG